MTYAELKRILRSTDTGMRLRDDLKRMMRFPTREDYIRQLVKHGLIVDSAGFIDSDRLTEAVYLDWLRRPQVGCVFAQLLARRENRTGLRTVVARGTSGLGRPRDLAVQIDQIVEESVNDVSVEALSVLMPQILDIAKLARIVWELNSLSRWKIEQGRQWRRHLVLIGLRVDIAPSVSAEVLGLGPFAIFPTTRQCPVTTLEIRTKTERARQNRLFKLQRAAHLAAIPVGHILSNEAFGARFKKYTPALRNRILEGQNDRRAKARVTYSLPAVIWSSLKSDNAEHS